VPVYFFDIRDDQGLHRDDIGLELADMAAAITEGRRALADMNRDAVARGEEHDFEILIRDHGEGPVKLSLVVTTEAVKDGRG